MTVVGCRPLGVVFRTPDQQIIAIRRWDQGESQIGNDENEYRQKHEQLLLIAQIRYLEPEWYEHRHDQRSAPEDDTGLRSGQAQQSEVNGQERE